MRYQWLRTASWIGQERTIADGSYPVPLVWSESLAQLLARIPLSLSGSSGRQRYDRRFS